MKQIQIQMVQGLHNLYGPSYLSFDYVLYQEWLIPETVYNTFTCATYNKRKIKTIINSYFDMSKYIIFYRIIIFLII